MRLLALLTPCGVLALLWALQRLEAWMKDTSGQYGYRRPDPTRHAAAPARRRLERSHHG